jgi:three-Cys-motif partner protein
MNELSVPGKIPRPIGRWECHKLECFADFIEDYSSSLSAADRYYIDPYAGCGSCRSKDIYCLVDDSQPRVLKTKFTRYIFIASEPPDAENLKRLTALGDTANKVEIITGSCLSEKVIRQLFDLIPRSASSFALIDPPGYRRLRWSLVKKLASHGSDWQGHKTELLIVFPLEMALLRNLNRPECEASITRLYGNQEWHQIRQDWQEGKIDTTEVRKRLVTLYKTGLKNLGYRYVASLEPAQSPHPPVYLLIWASDEANRIKMVADAWNRPRYLPGEMFYRDKQPAQ